MGIDGSWLVEWFVVDEVAMTPMESSTLTLEFAEGRIGGSAGVNRFMGTFGTESLFGPLATTLMSGPQPLMEQESAFLAALARATSMLYRPGELVLLADETPIMSLRPAETDDV
jgi:heat shock protein HslJ